MVCLQKGNETPHICHLFTISALIILIQTLLDFAESTCFILYKNIEFNIKVILNLFSIQFIALKLQYEFKG